MYSLRATNDQILILNKAIGEMIAQLCIHKADRIGISNQNHEEHVITWDMLMAKCKGRLSSLLPLGFT